LISVSGGGSPGRISKKKELGRIKILKQFELSDEKVFENYF